MQITITLKTLEDKGACTSGIEDFAKYYGEITEITIEWTRETQIELIKSPMRKHYGWAALKGLVPTWSMSGANLYGATLEGATLEGATLRSADLEGANLRGAKGLEGKPDVPKNLLSGTTAAQKPRALSHSPGATAHV